MHSLSYVCVGSSGLGSPELGPHASGRMCLSGTGSSRPLRADSRLPLRPTCLSCIERVCRLGVAASHRLVVTAAVPRNEKSETFQLELLLNGLELRDQTCKVHSLVTEECILQVCLRNFKPFRSSSSWKKSAL